jgi:hypothetical protein
VQSTTRYRKGTGTKKFARSDNPTPSRQISGRKGGICASKNKMQKQRFKDDPFRRPLQGVDAERRAQFRHQTRAQISHRHRSPLTPPSHERLQPHSPYLFKAEPIDNLELPYEDAYNIEDVYSVFNDDGPVFSSQHEPHLNETRLMSNHHY